MGASIELVEATLPLAYSIAAALFVFYLTKRPVHLDQYEQLRDTLDDPTQGDDLPSDSSSAAAAFDLAQAQYQAQRASGMGINLARLGLTLFQLALSVFIVIAFHLRSDLSNENDADIQYSLLRDSANVAAWSYALFLAAGQLTRPSIAYVFWVRPQMDVLYVLQLVLSSIKLYNLDILTLPFSEWSLRLKMEDAAWLATALLCLVSFVTKPFQPFAPAKIPKKEGEVLRKPWSEYSSSLYSQTAFSWVGTLVFLRFKQPLQDSDLPDLDRADLSEYSVAKFRKNKIISYMECKDCDPPTFDNYKWVFLLLIVSILESLTEQQALHRGRRLFLRLASVCNTAVFEKALRRKDVTSSVSDEKDDSKKDGEGEEKKDKTLNISNLVGVDIKEMENTISYLHDLYGLPLQLILSTTLLYNLLGKAAFVGIAFMIVTLPIPGVLFAAIQKLFKSIMSTKDDRMDYITEMLTAIRIVKFFGWESKFVEKITACREEELRKTRKTYVQLSFSSIAWNVVPLLNVVVVFLAYTKLYGNEITASVLFTTLAVFNILAMAMNNIQWQVMGAMRSSVGLKRISRFLDDDEIVQDTTITKIDGKAAVHTASHPIIGFVNASFSWPNKEHDKTNVKADKKPTLFQRVKAKFSKTPAPVVEPDPEAAVQERFKLRNISADFPVGQLSLIVGPTGSGKSAMLLALLGELERLDGHMYLPRLDYGESRLRGSGIAYVAQTAWLQNSTIRSNILFGKAFNQARYDAVVEACALVTDFDILESGDATEIGEQGITLSGGQKQRVALARAIYSDATVLLLDDCLSAVDSHTGKHLFQTLTGPLLEDRTVLMATHQVQLTLNSASYVVVLEKGEIVGAGSPDVVMDNGWVDRVAASAPVPDDESEISTLNGEERNKKAKKADKTKPAVKLIEDEKRAQGSVKWKVYMTYLSASGGLPFWTVIVLMFIGEQFLEVGKNGWLAMWANSMAEATGSLAIRGFKAAVPEPIALPMYAALSPVNGQQYGAFTMTLFGQGTPETLSVEFYLGAYILIGIIFAFSNILVWYYAMVVGSVSGSRVLHAKLLHKVARAKVRFYDTTPIGRIINRFSSDMATVDDSLQQGLGMFLSIGVFISGIVLVISINMPMFLVAAVFIVTVNVAIGWLYVPISRDLKRLNSNSKSPILNHFNETLSGVATIRAYGFQDRFLSTNFVNVDNNNRTFFLLWSTNRWLQWRINLTGSLVAFSTGMLLLRNWGRIEPGWAAMTLSYAMMFTVQMMFLIRIYADNEMNMNAVERISEYIDLEEEPPAIIEGSRPPASWPHSGEIEVDHLTVKYGPNTPEVLKDLTFKIKAGEKVGVVGRTGSGKSTLAISLFRFMEPSHGTIRIDGIDIGKIGLHDLRSNLTIIPQDPVLFKGTLRSNLDPFGEREDRELWEALRRSHLIPADSAALATATSSVKIDLLETPSSAAASASPSAPGSSAPSVKGSQSEETNVVDPSKITLDTTVKENGSNFSQGQRQLIALARALVRQPKVIVMDEATASVDFDTDLKIQTTIREEMADATIITIAHRIRTIADFDRVLVMNAGEVVEFDKPYKLMTKEDGVFRSMCERSTDFETLLAIAEAKEKKDAAAHAH
ncbi:hypothetical protein BGZ98_008023 [Dissophora globulifera]|nr:hypothetical protein BGZ98_008023 [Dissophora globulifera]